MKKNYRLKRKKKNLSLGLIAASVSSRVENVRGWTAAKIHGKAKSIREILLCFINKIWIRPFIFPLLLYWPRSSGKKNESPLLKATWPSMPGGLPAAYCSVGHVISLCFSYQNVNTFSLPLSVPSKVHTGCRKWKSWDPKGWDRCSLEKAWGRGRNLSKRTNELLFTYFYMIAVLILEGRNSTSVPSSQWMLWNLLKLGKLTNKHIVSTEKCSNLSLLSSCIFASWPDLVLWGPLSLLKESLQFFYHISLCGWIALLSPRKRGRSAVICWFLLVCENFAMISVDLGFTPILPLWLSFVPLLNTERFEFIMPKQ